MDRDTRVVTAHDIRAATREIGLVGRPICVHVSLCSFGWIEGGAASVVEGLLAEGCTVLAPTFSYRFGNMPSPGMRRWAQNAWQEERSWDDTEARALVYRPDSQDIDQRDMGAIATALLGMPGRGRGDHPLNSFAAVGPLAAELIAGQTPMDVYAPLKALVERDGAVVLMGVGLDKMTLLHLAEERAGRRMFRRWANGPNGQPMEVAAGGDSAGFPNLGPALDPFASERRVGASRWRAFPAGATLDAATRAIRAHPAVTRCAADCLECRDAIAGGPVPLAGVT